MMMSPIASNPAAWRDWLTAMRLPFTSVAVLPFLAGAYLSYAHNRLISPLSGGLGVLAVLLICVGCYLIGEIFDQREDLETIRHGRTRFSGGTLVVAKGRLTAKRVAIVAAASFLIAASLGLAIVFIHGSLVLLALGAFGMVSAVTYSMPPVRLVKRGLGELFIAICYGWLTLVTGYASASGELLPNSALLAIPVSLTVFNVILLNEFPDYEADRSTGKRNLLVRVGQTWGARIYTVTSIGTGLSILLLWYLFSRSSIELVVIIPSVVLATWLAITVGVMSRWRSLRTLEPLCGATIALNLLVAVTLAVVVRWS